MFPHRKQWYLVRNSRPRTLSPGVSPPAGCVHTLFLLGRPRSAHPRKEVYSPFLMARLLLTWEPRAFRSSCSQNNNSHQLQRHGNGPALTMRRVPDERLQTRALTLQVMELEVRHGVKGLAFCSLLACVWAVVWKTSHVEATLLCQAWTHSACNYCLERLALGLWLVGKK